MRQMRLLAAPLHSLSDRALHLYREYRPGGLSPIQRVSTFSLRLSPVLLCLGLIQQPGFFQSQGGLVGEGGQEGDFVFGPPAYLRIEYDQNAFAVVYIAAANVGEMAKQLCPF